MYILQFQAPTPPGGTKPNEDGIGKSKLAGSGGMTNNTMGE